MNLIYPSPAVAKRQLLIVGKGGVCNTQTAQSRELESMHGQLCLIPFIIYNFAFLPLFTPSTAFPEIKKSGYAQPFSPAPLVLHCPPSTTNTLPFT